MPWLPDLSNVLPAYLRSLYSLDLLTSYPCPWTPAPPDKSPLLLPSSVLCGSQPWLYFGITWRDTKNMPMEERELGGKGNDRQGRVVLFQDADLTGLVWSSPSVCF